ncbi:MAG TPA: hypothetical protein PLU67_04415 [Candidatus Kapabacteria bacterium]|jgi:hypothetical protein|nr:hypothetical protein [Candidatus Kapabacteria bacterium]HOM04722.1 hypothetical protein [Candidatus Kapabacteria bacterium]HPP39483.1 hypothetical protein [Candidatus Kapabacteria bacterium]
MYKMLLAAILLLQVQIFAQQHNLEVASSLADSVAWRLPIAADTALVRTSQSDAQMPILQAIARTAPVKIVSADAHFGDFLFLSPAVWTVDYSPISRNEIKRTISISLTFQRFSQNVLSPPETLAFSFTDTLSYARAEQINASSPEFLRRQLPAPKETLWEQYLRPAIVVATLAATVWLFFSVRSR